MSPISWTSECLTKHAVTLKYEASSTSSGSGLINEVHDPSDVSISGKITLPETEHLEMESFALEHRNSVGCAPEQDLLLGIAFVFPAALRHFRQFNSILRVDCTSGSNNEERPLLTISGKDSLAQNRILLRAFLPNECAWIFRWVFLEALPLLLGQMNISRVNVS